MKYQLVVLGQSKDRFEKALLEELIGRLKDLGLKPEEDLESIHGQDASRVDWEGIPVAIWFGGSGAASPDELVVLQEFLDENLPVFPVVEDITQFRQLIPKDAHRINGQSWVCAKVAADILREFHLTRLQRQMFISYKREDSQEAASQLFDVFSQRGYRVFLDTASVDAGADFQNVLWGRMADVDLLVFLDTPNALNSHWVHLELARAHDLGLGVLQLIWPNHTRTAGTEFSDYVELEIGDFQRRVAGPDDKLTSAMLEKISSFAEQARVRSLRARHMRVVTDLVDQATVVGLDAVVHPANPIELYKDQKKVADVIPFVGVPDAYSIHQCEEQLKKESLPKSLVVYNGLGVDAKWMLHLGWLNAHHSLATSQVDLLDAWLKKL